MDARQAREVLGVGANADAEEIRQAYRRLAMKHHPDRNPGAESTEEKFKEVKQAYERLQQADGGAAEGFWSPGDGSRGGDPFADLFGAIFGSMRQPASRVDVPLETAINGGRVVLGRGGRGEPSVEFELPPGVVNGALFELGGDAARVIQIHVTAPEGWELDGSVLVSTAKLGLFEQLLGTALKVDVPMVGMVELQIPSGLLDGQAFNVEHRKLRPYSARIQLDFSKKMALNDTELDLIRSARASYEGRTS